MHVTGGTPTWDHLPHCSLSQGNGEGGYTHSRLSWWVMGTPKKLGTLEGLFDTWEPATDSALRSAWRLSATAKMLGSSLKRDVPAIHSLSCIGPFFGASTGMKRLLRGDQLVRNGKSLQSACAARILSTSNHTSDW